LNTSSFFSFLCFKDLELSIGITVRATIKDISKEKVTVRANSLNIVAVIPLTNTIGKNTAIVVKVEATTAILTSLAPSTAALSAGSPSSLNLYIFSRTTIELSTNIPTPKAMPPRVIIFIVILPK